jgi:hypothetical protein
MEDDTRFREECQRPGGEKERAFLGVHFRHPIMSAETPNTAKHAEKIWEGARSMIDGEGTKPQLEDLRSFASNVGSLRYKSLLCASACSATLRQASSVEV